MIENRIARRTAVCMDVAVSTVLRNIPGILTDLSESGAKVQYPGAIVGERISIVALGQDVYGKVAWADPDRFGMKFDQPLQSGPLADYLHNLLTPPSQPNGTVQIRPRKVFSRKVFGRKAA